MIFLWVVFGHLVLVRWMKVFCVYGYDAEDGMVVGYTSDCTMVKE